MVKKLCLFILSLFFLTTTTFAAVFQLLDQPRPDAKVVGTIDSSTGINVIFTPKNSPWIKVGDPTNGNVGWIKSSQLNNAGFSFNVISTGPDKQNYHVFQFGNSPSSEQMIQMQKEWQLRQEAIEHDMQKMMHDMFTGMPFQWINSPGELNPNPPKNVPAPGDKNIPASKNVQAPGDKNVPASKLDPNKLQKSS